GWLFIPAAGQEESTAMSFLRGLAAHPARLGLALLALAALWYVATPRYVSLGGFTEPDLQPEVWFALILAGICVVLVLRGDRVMPGAAPSAARADAPAAPASSPASPIGVAAPEPMPAAPAAPSIPRERSPLAWYTVATALIVVGVLALIDNASTVRIE